MADLGGAIKHAAPRLAEEGLRSVGDALPAFARDGAKALGQGLTSLGESLTTLEGPGQSLADALPRIGENAAREVASDVRSLTVQIGKITTLIEMWTQLGRAGFPYVIAAIILHGAGGSTYTMATAVAWLVALWLLVKEAWQSRGEVAEAWRKVQDEEAEVEAKRSELAAEGTRVEQEMVRLTEERARTQEGREHLQARIRELEEAQAEVLRASSDRRGVVCFQCYLVSQHFGKILQVNPDRAITVSGNRGPWELFEVHLTFGGRPGEQQLAMVKHVEQAGFLTCLEGGSLTLGEAMDPSSVWKILPAEDGTGGLFLSVVSKGLVLQIEKTEVRTSRNRGPWERLVLEMAGPIQPSHLPLLEPFEQPVI